MKNHFDGPYGCRCSEYALDCIEAVRKNRTYERVVTSQCSSMLVDDAVRAVRQAASCPYTPAASLIWTWIPPAWGGPVVDRPKGA